MILLIASLAWRSGNDARVDTTEAREAHLSVDHTRNLHTIPHVGYLTNFDPSFPAPLARPHLDAFLQGLRELGYVDQENIIIEYRFAHNDPVVLSEIVNELVSLPVTAIVAADSLAMRAAQDATESVPLIMTTSNDPVAGGRVESLARPGGNITGLTVSTPGLAGKRLEVLQQLVPRTARVAVLWRRSNAAIQEWEHTNAAAQNFGIQLYSYEIRDALDIPAAMERAKNEELDAVLVFGTPLLNERSRQIASLALDYAMPLMGYTEEWVEAGALLSYAPSVGDLMRRSAGYVDRILQGNSPADIPIEQPTTFDFIVNLRTVESLGTRVDRRVLTLTTRLIQ
jgi:putative ABC transport system substrate-binding protein